MPSLHELHDRFGQSPWLDNLRRDWLLDGTIARWIERGVLGCTSNPSIFQKAMSAGDAYDAQLRQLTAAGDDVGAAYWKLVRDDIDRALDAFAPVHTRTDGKDGFVSLELAPDLAHDTAGSLTAARRLADAIDRPNLMIKVPATEAGIPAIQGLVAEGRNINITLIFGLPRYRQVMEAYLSGLEAFPGDPSQVRGVASFFVSRVDTEIDQRLERIGSPEALALRGRGAVAQARLAYQAFQETFRGPRWDALVARGADVQRPLWASTSTKNPAYPPTLYVDELIGPDTVNTLPEGTLDLFEEQGTLARRIDADVADAEDVFARLAAVGVDLDDVSRVLEDEGVASFDKAFDEVHASLADKAAAFH
ncbi:MAG TPA: transaldolase [Acidimicrobiales bacterium]|jgi:transaldolase